MNVNNYSKLFATHSFTNFTQGYLLYLDPDLKQFGIIVFVINWLPGVTASIHLLSNQATDLGFLRTLLCCGKSKLCTSLSSNAKNVLLRGGILDIAGGDRLKGHVACAEHQAADILFPTFPSQLQRMGLCY